jgi:hypothetical protein
LIRQVKVLFNHLSKITFDIIRLIILIICYLIIKIRIRIYSWCCWFIIILWNFHFFNIKPKWVFLIRFLILLLNSIKIWTGFILCFIVYVIFIVIIHNKTFLLFLYDEIIIIIIIYLR